MIHVSDMSWARKINHPSEVLKKADEVEAIVLEVSPENQRISLGLKQAQEDPWAGISGRYQIGQLIKGKVSKLASFGAFVELEGGVDGLVHISQVSDDHVAKIRDVLQPGQEVEARVIKIDPIDRRIGLSIKAAKMADDEFQVDDSMLEGLRPGEDLVDLAGAFDAALGSGEEQEEWSPGAAKVESKTAPEVEVDADLEAKVVEAPAAEADLEAKVEEAPVAEAEAEAPAEEDAETKTE